MEQKTVTQSGALGYSGLVTAIIKDNKDRVYYQNTFHNKGCSTLFKFLCECLAGDYTDADKFRPMRLKIFNYKYDEGTQTPTPAQARKQLNNDQDFSTNIKALSGYITTDTRPVVKNEDNNYSVVFHFNVPFAYLASAVESKLNLMMLYTSSQGATESKVSENTNGLIAYYLCTNVVNGVESWDPIDIKKFTDLDNTNLIIEWKMSINNIE